MFRKNEQNDPADRVTWPVIIQEEEYKHENKIYLYFWYGIFNIQIWFLCILSKNSSLPRSCLFSVHFSLMTRGHLLTYISAANWEAGVWSDDSLREDAQQWVMRFSLRPMEMLASLGQYSGETEREKTENKGEPQRTKDPKFKSLILHSLCQCSSLFFVSLTFTLFLSAQVLSVVCVCGDVTVTFLEHDMGNSDNCSLPRHQ